MPGGSYTSGEGRWEDRQDAELGNRKRRRKRKSKMVRRRKTRKENEKAWEGKDEGDFFKCVSNSVS